MTNLTSIEVSDNTLSFKMIDSWNTLDVDDVDGKGVMYMDLKLPDGTFRKHVLTKNEKSFIIKKIGLHELIWVNSEIKFKIVNDVVKIIGCNSHT